MVLPRLLRNHTRNDSAGLGVKSRRLSTVARPPASISARSFSQDARATSVCSAGQRICMISRERLPLWIGSGSPAGIERAALVGSDASGLAKRAYVTLEESAFLLVACRPRTSLCRRWPLRELLTATHRSFRSAHYHWRDILFRGYWFDVTSALAAAEEPSTLCVSARQEPASRARSRGA
jgi:hypothetical protein